MCLSIETLIGLLCMKVVVGVPHCVDEDGCPLPYPRDLDYMYMYIYYSPNLYIV